MFKPIRSFCAKQGLAADFVAKTGNAGDTIAAIANKGKFDLAMLGSHGHGVLGNRVLGSVATKVVANSSVPVLLVR